MLAVSTTGANRWRIARIWWLFAEHSRRGTGTHIARGQRRNACDTGIADRTPNALVSYEAEQTTPRLSAEPPTMRRGARPAPSGSTNRATATKNASASASRTLGMRRARLHAGTAVRGRALPWACTEATIAAATYFTRGVHDGKHGRIQSERTQRHRISRHAAERQRERAHRQSGILGPGGPYQRSRGAVRQGRVRDARARPLPWEDHQESGRGRQAAHGAQHRRGREGYEGRGAVSARESRGDVEARRHRRVLYGRAARDVRGDGVSRVDRRSGGLLRHTSGSQNPSEPRPRSGTRPFREAGQVGERGVGADAGDVDQWGRWELRVSLLRRRACVLQ